MGSRKAKHLKKNKPNPSQLAGAPASGPLVLEPKPWPATGEIPEDSAVFNGEILQTLPESLRGDCTAVKTALELVENGQDELASSALQSISRQSPYSDWRLFIRGLSEFYAQAYNEASQAWSRLTATRRPARIACVLLDSIGVTRPETLASVVVTPEALPVARQTLDRTCILSEAKKIAAARHRDRDVSFSMAQASMLRGFGDRFRRIDKAFALRFMQACVVASTQQSDKEPFTLVRGFTPGPDYDPHWVLAELTRCLDCDDDARENLELLDKYFEGELPQCKRLTVAAQGAIKSLLLTQYADSEYISKVGSADFECRLKMLTDAVGFCPKNRAAHDVKVEMLVSALEDEDDELSAKAKQLLVRQLTEALEQQAQAFPVDAEVANQLAQAYMECDLFDQAAKEAQRAIELRRDSPKSQALPWKIKLHQAMHAARLKTNFHLIDAILEDAVAMWPSWLSREWIPYLEAAVEQRRGNSRYFQFLKSPVDGQDKIPALTSALMAYLAVQKFNVPGKELKVFRDRLDEQVALAKLTTAEDLAWAASFLWDMERADLNFVGMVRREKNIGEAIINRAKSIDFKNPHGEACYCWLAQNDFFDATRGMKSLATTPHMAMAYVDYMARIGRRPDKEDLAKLVQTMENGLATESDPWYRDELTQTVDVAQEYLAMASGDQSNDFETFANFAQNFAAQMGLDLNEIGGMPELKRMFELNAAEFSEDEDEEDDEDEDEWDESDEDFDDADEDEIAELSEALRSFHQAQPESPVPPGMTAAERKAFDKQRQKELQRAKKRS